MKTNRFMSLILAITMVLSMVSFVTVSAAETLNVEASVYGVGDIGGKTSFGGTLRTVSKVNAETNVKLVVAVFNGTSLQKAQLFEVNLLPDDTVLDTPFAMTELDGIDNQTAKAYLWKDEKTLEPLTEVMPIEGEISVRVEGVASNYNRLSAVIDGYTADEDDVITYQWQHRVYQNNEHIYTDVVKNAINFEEETAQESTFTPLMNSADRRYRVKVTINGDEYFSSDINDGVFMSGLNQGVHRILKNDGVNDSQSYIIGYANKTTPEEYVFTTDGMEFILLDETKSDTAAFMIMTKNSVGKRNYYIKNGIEGDTTTVTGTDQQPFDMTAWLNNLDKVTYFGGRGGITPSEWSAVKYSANGYKGNAEYIQIPENVLKHIDNNVSWYVEKGRWWSDTSRTDQFMSVNSGLQILSLTELLKYSDRIGLAEAENWWLRTPGMNNGTTNSDGNWIQYVSADVLGTTVNKSAYESMNLRPVFYTDKDFFLEVPVDLETAGAAVIKTIALRYSRDELKAAGYSEADLNTYFDPIVSYSGNVTSANIVSEGTYEVNNTLKLEISGTNIDEAKIQWYTSLTNLGCFVEAEGKTGNTFIPSDSEAGKYVKAKITLKDGSTYDSNVIKLADALETVGTYDGTTTKIGTNETDQQEYIFTVGDIATDGTVSNEKQLVLLDTTENDASHFLVMTNAYIGTRRYYEGAVQGSAYNDSTYVRSPIDMAAYLNSLDEVTMYINGEQLMMPDYEYAVTENEGVYTYTYKQKTDDNGAALTRPAYGAFNYGSDGQPLTIALMEVGKKPTTGAAKSILPNSVWNSINYNQVWNCEPMTEGGKTTRYAVKAGLMVPSVTEIAKYASKINLYPGGRVTTAANVQNALNSCWWTRTPVAGGSAIKCVNFANVGQIADRNYHTEWNNGLSVRPIFYLNRDFFIKNKIDLSKAGSDVLSVIRATYSDEELLTVYEQTEIDTYLPAATE